MNKTPTAFDLCSQTLLVKRIYDVAKPLTSKSEVRMAGLSAGKLALQHGATVKEATEVAKQAMLEKILIKDVDTLKERV